jgi:hypothetical protein
MITPEQYFTIIEKSMSKDEVEEIIDYDDFKWDWSQKRTTIEEFLSVIPTIFSIRFKKGFIENYWIY